MMFQKKCVDLKKGNRQTNEKVAKTNVKKGDTTSFTAPGDINSSDARALEH